MVTGESTALHQSSPDDVDNTLLYSLRIINCLLILLHGVVLWILTMNTIKYLRQFGN
jgi:hypothetical protein